jgi:hypothetical protein
MHTAGACTHGASLMKQLFVKAEAQSYLLTARWKYSDTIAAEPFRLMVLLFLTAVAMA